MIENFKKNHQDHFRIESFTSIKKLKDAAIAEEPDLILLDLFWVLPNVDPELKRIADDKLRAFQKQLRELREAVYQAYDHQGIDGLKMIRKNEELRETPIMIYSKSGQLLLDNRGLHEVIEANAEWLPKSQENVTPDIESLWMERFIKHRNGLMEAITRLSEENERLSEEIKRLTGFDWKLLLIAFQGIVIAILLYPYAVMVDIEHWQKGAAIAAAVVSFLTAATTLGGRIVKWVKGKKQSEDY